MSVGVVKITDNKIQLAADNQVSYGRNKFLDSEKQFLPSKIVQNDHVAFVSAGWLEVTIMFDIYTREHKILNNTDIGITNYIVDFYEWLRAKNSDNKNMNQFILVVENKVWDIFDLMVRPIGKFSAIGSGMFLALGALSMGADAKKAVEAAIEYDLYCGGEIHLIEFKK